MCHNKELAANFLIMYTFKNKLTPCFSRCGVDYNVYVRFYSVNVEVKSVICTIWFKTYYLQKTYSYHLLNETVSLEDTAISLHRPVPHKKSFVKSSNLGGGGYSWQAFTQNPSVLLEKSPYLRDILASF